MEDWNETTLASEIKSIYRGIVERTFLVASDLDEEHVTREMGLQMVAWFQTKFNKQARGHAWVDLYKAFPDVFKRNINEPTKLLPDYWEVIQVPHIESSANNFMCVALTKPNFENRCGFDVLWHFKLPTAEPNTWAGLTYYLQAKLCHYTKQGPEVDFTFNQCDQLVALLKTYYDFAPDDVSTPLPGYLVYNYNPGDSSDPNKVQWGLYFIPAQHVRQALLCCHENGKNLLGANHNRPYQNRILTKFFLTENYRLEKWLNTESDTDRLEGFDAIHTKQSIHWDGADYDITFFELLEFAMQKDPPTSNLRQGEVLLFLKDVYSKMEAQIIKEVKEGLEEIKQKKKKKGGKLDL